MEDASAYRAIVHAPLRLPSPLQPYRMEQGRHADHGHLILSSLGGAEAEYNNAVVLGPEPSARVFALADAFFAASKYHVVVEAGAAPQMEDALRRRGWQLAEEDPALVLSPIPISLSGPIGLTIRPVTTEGQFEEFLALSGTPLRWVPSLRAALDPEVALFVGYLGEKPVAVSRLTCYGAVGEVLGVTTLPAQRRKGFGAALTWAAIAEAARRGCTAITLNATESGYPLYRQMGFVPVAIYRNYRPPGC